MPIQKGKKHKRPRRRGRADSAVSTPEESTSPDGKQSSAARPAGRRPRWEPPLWLNVTIGLTLLLFGVLFSLTPSKGMSPGLHTFFLVLYVFLSGLYLSKAFKQYRSRQQS